MADNTVLNLGSGGDTIATKDIAGVKHELVMVEFSDGAGGVTDVSAANPLPVAISSDIQIGAVEIKNGSDDTRATVTAANALKVDGSAVTQPVSGTFFQVTQPVSGTFFQVTQPVSAASLPLPTLAATSTKQSDGTQKTQVVDGSGNVIAATSNALNVNISSGSLTPSGTQDENIKQVNGATVNVGIGAASTGTQRVAVSNDSTIGLVAGIAEIGNVKNSGTFAVQATLQASSAVVGHVINDAGSAIIGKVGIDQTTPGTTNLVALTAETTKVIGTINIAAAQTLATVTTVTGITNNVNTVSVAPTTIFNGKTSVTTAGTRVVLAASQAVQSVTIKALSANTGFIYVGNASVSASNGFQLSAGDTISMDIANLNTVNIDSSVNGESVSYIGIN